MEETVRSLVQLFLPVPFLLKSHNRQGLASQQVNGENALDCVQGLSGSPVQRGKQVEGDVLSGKSGDRAIPLI